MKKSTGGTMMKRIIEIIVLILLGGVLGCSSTPLGEDQLFDRDHKRQMAVNNWHFCKKLMEAHRETVWHYNHMHDSKDRVKMAGPNGVRQATRDDLHYNQCRRRLGEAWEQ